MALYREKSITDLRNYRDEGEIVTWYKHGEFFRLDYVSRHQLNHWIEHGDIPEDARWLEPIEPSPDIQKRAEEIIENHSIDGENEPAYTDIEVRQISIQLATEAVAAEREKYEKEIREMKSEADKYRLALESLSPGGSEYYKYAERCVRVIRQRFESNHEILADTIKKLKQANREIEQLQQRIKELEYGK